ncbi:MAG: LemA family protein [Pyrinomonas sp.]|uniref:LemA family protein n=1 Tax=Pyrinomonas sp. TaxID=2080306 RepID=UPI00331CCFDC
MKKKHFALLAAIALIALANSGCGYNTLVEKQQNVRAKWANVEATLQRRADLIPNLVAAAQMAGIQEQEVFGQIAQARSQLLNATQGDPQNRTPEQREQIIQANQNLSSALGRLLVLVENYPTLRSNESFLKLQDEIAGTENRIAVARQDYNAAVQDYNTTRNQFPMVLVAGLFGFKEEPYFRAEEGAREAPRIDPNALRRNNANSNAR